MIEKMIEAGMNVARLNFSHGDFSSHGEVIQKIRAASKKIGKWLLTLPISSNKLS